MRSKLEILPNEIFLNVFLYFSWDEVLISFWSLNKRINALICSIFEINRYGIIFNQPGLSYKKFSNILLPLIFNSLSLRSSIKYIHFDGINSIYFNLIYQDIFSHNDDKSILCFPNLKSLYISRCLLSQSLIQTLSFLIQYQLNQLTLTFDEDLYETFGYGRELSSNIPDQGKLKSMFKQILCQMFSNQCQLTSLQLDIAKLSYEIHQSLNSYSYVLSNKTLRRLYIHLDHMCFLENLLEYVPNLEQLSVHLRNSLIANYSPDSNITILKLSNGNWFNKVPILKSFTLKSFVRTIFELTYLKWLLNNLNHITKLEIHLYMGYIWQEHQLRWKYVIDANFIRQYCLPDQIINLKYFYFYICAKYHSSLDNISKIINTFKINSFFIDHHWTNTQCFYDENTSAQHIFSSNLKKFQRSIVLVNHRYIYEWPDIEHIQNNNHPSFYLFLKQFDELCPNISSMTINIKSYDVKPEILQSLPAPFKMGQRNLNDSQLQNVTKLIFGHCFRRRIRPYIEFTDQYREYVRILAFLISMPVQLKYLFVQKFEWLLNIMQRSSYNVRRNVLHTVRYAEFGISSCNVGDTASILVGKNLVPFLNTYIPYLQTLRLWRPDDFPWTSLRLNFKAESLRGNFMSQWKQTLLTSKSINEHVIVFEQDLCQLVEQLKQFLYLDIYGKIDSEKVKSYHLMVQKRFPNSRNDIQISRFSLWI